MTYICDINAMPKSSETHVPPYEVTSALLALGKHLARARLARGDTQKVTGERCGLHPQTIARIEAGDATVGISKVFTLMALYGMAERLFELARTDEATEILYRKHLPSRGRSKP